MEAGLAAVAACTGVAVLLVVVSILITFHRRRENRLNVEAAFAGRDPQTPLEFHERFFASRGVPLFVTAGVLKVLESEMGTDISRISADDDFAGNLRSLRRVIEDPATMLSIERVFEITVSESDAHEMGTTVGDLIMLVWRTLQKKA